MHTKFGKVWNPVFEICLQTDTQRCWSQYFTLHWGKVSDLEWPWRSFQLSENFPNLIHWNMVKPMGKSSFHDWTTDFWEDKHNTTSILTVLNLFDHTTHTASDLTYCYRRSMVCQTVCLLDTPASPAKITEQMEMPFQVWIGGGPDPPLKRALLADILGHFKSIYLTLFARRQHAAMRPLATINVAHCYVFD